MDAKSVLEEFRKQRNLFVGVQSNDVQALLEGMNRLIGRSKAIGQIVNDVYAMPNVRNLLELMVRGGSAKAGTIEEVAGVGFHIIQNCKGHITTFCSEIGIRPPHGRASRQEYVDSVMNFYIRNAFDFIEEKLEEMGEINQRNWDVGNEAIKTEPVNVTDAYGIQGIESESKFGDGWKDEGWPGKDGPSENGETDGEDKDWLEQEIVKQEERDNLKFALETKSIMKVAMQLEAMKGNDKWELHTREILVAIAYSGQRKESDYKTAQFALEKLRRNKSDYLEDYFKRIDSETSIDKIIKGKVLKRTGYAGDALRWAKKCALSTTDKNLIRIRHLLAALLFFRVAGKETLGAHNVVKEAGIGLTAFIREFQQYVTNTFKDDKTEAWRKIFGEIQQETEEIEISKYGKGHIATIQMDRISEVDLLGRDRLVGAFAGMFVHTEEVEGFTVALLGDWGEGKSTVMKLLEKRLNEKHPGRFEFATFNAWEYERTDNIAAGLAQEVVNGLIEPLQQDFREIQRLRFQFALQEYKGELWRLAIYSVVALFIVLISCIFLENNTLKGLGLAGGIAAVLFLLFKYLPTIIEHPIAIKLETYLKLPNYGKHLGDIPIIQSHLKTLCSLRLVDNKKLIVFIDDLDRCQTDCIAGALDAIRLLMNIQNVIVMIGIDYRIAFKAMENYYEKLGDKKRDASEIARDYLGKIIQLPVRLMHSSPEEVRNYIEERLFRDAQGMEDIEKDGDKDLEGGVTEPSKPKKEIIEAEGEEDKVRTPDDKKVEEPKSVEEVLKDTTIERDMFSNLAQRFNFTNPRQLLRLRNSYRFLKVMDSDEKYDREILMKILFWQEFLNNLPSIIRDQCEKSVKERESLAKIEKPEARQIVQDVREDILKIIEMPMYEEIERFVHIVVLPHSEGRILDTR